MLIAIGLSPDRAKRRIHEYVCIHSHLYLFLFIEMCVLTEISSVLI